MELAYCPDWDDSPYKLPDLCIGLLVGAIMFFAIWIGDDIFVINVNISYKGIEQGVVNRILIKPNQIGTVSETLAAVRMAEKHITGQ